MTAVIEMAAASGLTLLSPVNGIRLNNHLDRRIIIGCNEQGCGFIIGLGGVLPTMGVAEWPALGVKFFDDRAKQGRVANCQSGL